MSKKAFIAPHHEVVRFNNSVISTSVCTCYDELLGNLGVDCTNDGSGCGCPENYGFGANCVTPKE